MINIKNEADKIAEAVTKLIKQEIRNKNLIDSGDLLKSIKAVATVNGYDFKITVNGLDYFKYLDKDYDIITDVKASKGYKEILNMTSDLYLQIEVEKIKDKIKKINK